jgi:hypothetical protein
LVACIDALKMESCVPSLLKLPLTRLVAIHLRRVSPSDVAAAFASADAAAVASARFNDAHFDDDVGVTVAADSDLSASTSSRSVGARLLDIVGDYSIDAQLIAASSMSSSPSPPSSSSSSSASSSSSSSPSSSSSSSSLPLQAWVYLDWAGPRARVSGSQVSAITLASVYRYLHLLLL